MNPKKNVLRDSCLRDIRRSRSITLQHFVNGFNFFFMFCCCCRLRRLAADAVVVVAAVVLVCSCLSGDVGVSSGFDELVDVSVRPRFVAFSSSSTCFHQLGFFISSWRGFSSSHSFVPRPRARGSPVLPSQKHSAVSCVGGVSRF